MGVEHGWLLFILGCITSIVFFYIILTVMSNEKVDDSDSDNSI